MKQYNLGVDIGSTTLKFALLDHEGNLIASDYRRHNANIRQTALEVATKLYQQLGDCELKVLLTGSVGMGYAERLNIGFVQEVVASAETIKTHYPEVRTFIDMGGEDSKMIFFEEGKVPDIRMNGSCAGGTGAFIDQTATLFGIETEELNTLAANAKTEYPIASRCGVFSKTDIQNLMSRNVSREDIAASVFTAVALQVIASLARGMDILPKVFFCGGPFAFLPELKKHFMKILDLKEEDCLLPDNAELIPATGCAIMSEKKCDHTVRLKRILAMLRLPQNTDDLDFSTRLDPLFKGEDDYHRWLSHKHVYKVVRNKIQCAEPTPYFLGIDSGSTTTKLVLLNMQGEMVYSDYRPNQGDSFNAAHNSLKKLHDDVANPDNIIIVGSCVTGYGENLIKAAFNFDYGIVETMAHFLAAKQVTPDVSFVLDIGGQDMKAIFVNNGSIRRMEINEACSSGCGSFIETFANMLGYPVEEFAHMSCQAPHPCDLGTRCTVFMNSKVKQAMREGADVCDIAAGFSYSVVKNCLFKVLKLKNIKELGNNIVVQGGTFKNHSIVRALERLTGCEVSFSDIPELMGAYGCALYALRMGQTNQPVTLTHLVHSNSYESSFEVCPGCANHCTVKVFKFSNGNTFYSGNNCEKHYSNHSDAIKKGVNMYTEKYQLLFSRHVKIDKPRAIIGIPRGLGMYENYPFWYTLFTTCGFRVTLSSPSTNRVYDSGIRTIMADNICFPAKLMHGHIMDLVNRKVDRIFYPYVVYERKEDEDSKNSYNCPIVAGYSDVLKSSMNTAKNYGIEIDAPVITFSDPDLLYRSCGKYLAELGVDKATAKRAIQLAWEEQNKYLKQLTQRATEVLEAAEKENRMVILLAGRPYHIDPLIEHKISSAISEMGIDVITENVATVAGSDVYKKLNAVSQWAYPNRIFKAAYFVGKSKYPNLHYVELTSFGCGPDAFILDEVNAMLQHFGKNLTILKIDDVNNIGSLRLRVRSLVESVRMQQQPALQQPKPILKTKVFEVSDRRRTILAPYFAEGYSEFLPSLFSLLGYHLVNLPMGSQADAETGLKYANNDICYPATIVVGSIMNALKSGEYDLNNTAVAITQTGGQCRASNYYSLIKNAILSEGFTQVPVISMATNAGVSNNQPGFTIKWSKVIKITAYTMMYADCLAKLYHASVVREIHEGDALRLRHKYTELGNVVISQNRPSEILNLMKEAVSEFNDHIDATKKLPRIGIVGEIYVKYNGFSNKYVVDWLAKQGIEIIAPSILNFFTNSIAHRHVMRDMNLKKLTTPVWFTDAFYRWLQVQMRRFDRICKAFPFYTPFTNIFDDVKNASKIVNPAGNFGEGWLIPAEYCHLASIGVNNVVSLQPFGCIANHVISKGIEKKVKQLYPKMNLLFLDFDSSTSDANVFNRLHFMVENAKQQVENQ